MKFGVSSTVLGPSYAQVAALWRHLDASGWDAVAVPDHFMPNTEDRIGDMLEAWTLVAALAAETSRIRVGTLVSSVTYRHPAVLAKMAATIDVLSGGRLICGIGAGWQANEHAAYGIPFPSTPDRLARLEEACLVLKRLWTEDRVDLEGRFYRLDGAPLMPKPVQRPHPELLIGGGGERRTLAIAARHADHWNVWGGPETLARKGRILDEHCAREARDPRSLLRSAVVALVMSDAPEDTREVEQLYRTRFGGDEALARDVVFGGGPAAVTDKLGRLEAAGVGMVWISTALIRGPWERTLDDFMARVAPSMRGLR